MALNYIWIALFAIGVLVGVIKLVFLGDMEALPAMMDSTFEMSNMAFEMTLGLTGMLTFWMGIMKIGEDSGLIEKLARFLSPVLTKLFPEIPKNHPALGSIFMNISANMLGLDNAATPVGLKAMQELQSINKQKDTASNSMIMFLVLNTSSLMIIHHGIQGKVWRCRPHRRVPADTVDHALFYDRRTCHRQHLSAHQPLPACLPRDVCRHRRPSDWTLRHHLAYELRGDAALLPTAHQLPDSRSHTGVHIFWLAQEDQCIQLLHRGSQGRIQCSRQYHTLLCCYPCRSGRVQGFGRTGPVEGLYPYGCRVVWYE